MAGFANAIMRSLECPICFSRLTQPKLLACSHTFCETCLKGLQSPRAGNGSISCPICRQGTAVGAGGVSSLQTNFPLKGILSEVNAYGSADDATVPRTTHTGLWSNNMFGKNPDQSSVQHCVVCDKGLTADYYCCECEQYMCNACHQTHSKLRSNVNHEVLSADDMKWGKVMPRKSVLCQEHRAGEGEHRCTDVCITCKKPMCVRCMVKHHKAGHSLTSVNEYKESYSSVADSLRVNVEAKISNVVEQNELIEAEKRKVLKHMDLLGRQIDTTYSEISKRLKEDKLALDNKCKAEKEALCQKLDEMKIKHQRLIEKLQSSNSLVIDSIQKPLEVDTLASREVLCEQLKQVLSEDNPSSAGAAELSGRACKLEYEQSPECTGIKLGNVYYGDMTIETDVTLSTADSMECMAATPDGKMAVGCVRGECGIEIYSADGQLRQRVLNGVKVYGIAFLSDGRCAVRDTGNTNTNILNVSLYTQGWGHVHGRFDTLSWDEGGTGGVTVDRDDHIYVGYMKPQKIQVFTPAGGKPVREIACDVYRPIQICAMKRRNVMVLMNRRNISRTMDPSGGHLIERKCIERSIDWYTFPAVCKDDTILIATVNNRRDRVTIERYTSELQHVATHITNHVIQKTDRNYWAYLQEFTSGEIAFCTADRLYIFS